MGFARKRKGEPMSDLIDRQTAIDVAFDIFPDDEYFLEQFVKSIEALPSAQPERESAKFIRWMECKKTDKYISYTPHCKCSKCGNELLVEAINYCYMCGARMEGERRTDER